jgi:4-hydroxybenzoate polyprenyltransferase
LIGLTILLTQLSISVLNDWADRKRDALAGRRRPVALGRISPPAAFGLAIVLAVASLAAAYALGWRSFLLVILGLAAGWSYDLFLKPTPFSIVPFAIGFPVLALWAAVAVDRPLRDAPVLFLGGVPLAIAIHLADAIPDREADAMAGLRTPAVVLPYPIAEIGAASLFLVAVGVVYVALWQTGRLDWPMLSPLALVLLYLSLSLGRSYRLPQLARQTAKWSLICGAALLGLLLALIAAYD